MPSNAPSPDSLRRLHNLIWTLIYAGIVAIAAGFAVRDAAPGAFPLLAAGGAVAILAGAVLVYLRSRMPAAPPERPVPPPARDGR